MSLLTRLRPPSRIHSTRLAATLLGAGAVGLAACADAPTAPAPRAAYATSTTTSTSTTPLYEAAALTRPSAIGAQQASAVIGPAGGTLTLTSAGITVVVPPNAVSKLTTFTVTAPSGTGVWYEFQPQGARFAVPLQVTQSLRATNYNALSSTQRAALRVGYFKDGTINTRSNSAPIYEELPLTIDATLTKATFKISHFSGYMMSTGRRGTY